jgi:3-oxoacyl-[acyl-carrier protein] reductase
MRLKNKVAFITGGSRGIGAAITARLANEGARVAFTYNNSDERAQVIKKEIENNGGQALAIKADSGDPVALTSAISMVVSEWGSIDILVSNAGVFIGGTIDQATINDFNQTVSVNVQSVFVAAREVLLHMKDGGRIITIGSNMADRVSMAGASLYGMSKSALIGLTKGMARDLGPKKITANLVQPGPTNTDMNPEDGPTASMQIAMTALSHYGKPGDIAGLVAFLASEESGFITGTAITIDGGTNA